MSEARELARVAVIEGQQPGLERISVWLCWGPRDLGKTSFLPEAFFIVKGLSVNPGILPTRSDFSAPETSGGSHRNLSGKGHLQVFL